jgi:hypothetical protein
MFYRFRYESEFYPALSRVPLYVRMKLDLAGVKISLNDWFAYGFEERVVLCHLPIDTQEEKTALTSYLDFLSRKYRGEPVARTDALSDALWSSANQVPGPVADRSATRAQSVTPEEWARWKTHQRYALYKTATSKSEPEVFYEVLQELREEKR